MSASRNATRSKPRALSAVDRILLAADRALRATGGGAQLPPQRASPAEGAPETDLADEERDLAARLMRVNHAGEVAAQALYEGQAATAREPRLRRALRRAAREERDHLAWCAARIDELGGAPSVLGPVWYSGSFAIGALAGLAGASYSLGFVAETERQVIEHLEGHLDRLPATDARTRAILEQMQRDEAQHGENALRAGAAELPEPIRRLMRLTARVMTGTAFWV